MLHSRFNLITADPAKLGDAVTFIESAVRPAVESQPGSLGMSLYTNPTLGVAVLESVWASGDAMRDSEHTVSQDRRDAVQRAAGTVCVERYRVPVFEQEAPVRPGAGLRLTRMDIEPSRVEDGVEAYGDTVVPWLAETDGFCSASLLIDQNTGHSIGESVWSNPEALAASRSVAAAMRLDMAASSGCVIRAVEEYGLVFSSARKA